ncbi:MAG: NAD(P)/FAD-dependent oxidoreductase, partial [bacterium]|nr:NAD(P)/FAD-dependent oxidoreductase [bacterium]
AIPGIEHIKYLTPKTLLQTTRPPKSLFIIGSGSTAVEIAQLMATFGTKVYISEVADRILPEEDDEVGEVIGRILKEQKGVTALTHTRILSVKKENIAKRVTFSRGDREQSVRVDEILVATDRTPTVDLGLENASVKYSAKGIEVNEQLQTTARHIYAAGDVLGRHSHTHSALMESRIAINNILHRSKATPDYTATPRVTFTHPGVASVGLTEYDCIKRDLGIKKAIAPLNIIARSNTSDFRDGFVKIITNHHGIILGATIVAPEAAEMIHELALAVKYRMTASDVANTPHAFLSWSEAIRVAAAKLTR